MKNEAMQWIGLGLGSNEGTTMSNNILFKEGSIISQNSEFAVVVPFKYPTEFEGLAVNGSFFLSAFAQCPEAPMVLNGSMLCFQSKSKIKIATTKPNNDDVIDNKIFAMKEKITLSEEQISAIVNCSKYCSTDMGRPILNFVACNGNTIVGCSGSSILQFTMKDKIAPILVYNQMASVMDKFAPTAISVLKEWIVFKNAEGVAIASRTINETYPDVKSILETSNVVSTLTFEDSTIDQLSVAEKMSSHIGSADCTVTIADKKMVISSSSESGQFRIVQSVKAKDCSFIISLSFLKKILAISNNVVMCGNKIVAEDGNKKSAAIISKK